MGVPTEPSGWFLPALFALGRKGGFVGFAHVVLWAEGGMGEGGDGAGGGVCEFGHFDDAFGVEFGGLLRVEVVTDVDIDVLGVRVQHL